MPLSSDYSGRDTTELHSDGEDRVADHSLCTIAQLSDADHVVLVESNRSAFRLREHGVPGRARPTVTMPGRRLSYSWSSSKGDSAGLLPRAGRKAKRDVVWHAQRPAQFGNRLNESNFSPVGVSYRKTQLPRPRVSSIRSERLQNASGVASGCAIWG
jgi:hypothetical protein